MKRLMQIQPKCNDKQSIFCMSKLTDKYADKRITGDFGKFIYFSPVMCSSGPRIKFYGGTKHTDRTKTAPTLTLSTRGAETIELSDWMNKQNCPNAFDDEYLSKVETFANKFISILLLVWFNHLDESDALEYFNGHVAWNTLMSYIDIDDLEINNCKTVEELHQLCLSNHYYNF